MDVIRSKKGVPIRLTKMGKEDGFVITAFLTRRKKQIERRRKRCKEADVLYINFKKPSHADDSELTDDDIIIRYEKGDIVGITILNASRRKIGHGHGV
jgi:uncharacterized protein YuzE